MSREQCYGEKEGLMETCANLGEQERFIFKGCVACAGCMKELEKLSETDPLTELPNERAARKRFSELQDVKPFGVIFMDLVNFKYVNEVRSHRFGDQMLQAVAESIDSRPRRRQEGEDSLAVRKGGDEFIGIVNLERRNNGDLSDETRLETVRARYVSDLNQEPLVVAYNQLVPETKQLSLRTGSALYRPGMSFEELLGEADPKGTYALPQESA